MDGEDLPRRKYDQLQRLKKQEAWDWNGSAYAFSTGYGMTISYDYGGNIKTLRRDGDPTTVNMDNLTYNYGNTNKPNRLTHIDDAYTTASLTEDLEDQSANNYTYDNIGNMTGDVSEGGKTVTWNVYNKITAVSMSSGTKTLAFGYDATGNRVRKEYTIGGVTTKQWYVRDAQGNILSVYKQVGAGNLQQNVNYLYGSTRVGELIVNRDSAVTWNRHYYRVKGNRHYELTNHLGNVLAVVTDRKIAKDTTADATYTPQFFMPDVYSVQNYYAFGQTMPKWSTTTPVNDPTRYRFGFNGKEDDDEWSKQDYGFRIYDARVARFLSVDPIAKDYPWYTPYQFAGNMPIGAVDLDGLEEYYAADGQYLGNSGGLTEIRIIGNKDVIPKAKENLSHPKYDHKWLLEHSKTAYKYDQSKEIDLLNDWAVINLKKIEDREPTMSLFTKDLVKKGKSFKAVIEGSTERGDRRSKYRSDQVDPRSSTIKISNVDLEKEFGWKREVVIHGHPGWVDSPLSNEFGDLGGYSGDIPTAIKMNVRMIMVNNGSNWAKLFDPAIYNKINPKGMNADSEEHFQSSEKATNDKYFFIQKN